MAVAFHYGSVGGAAKACVGPLSARTAVAGQTRQRDIIGHRLSISGHIRAYSGHIRIRNDHRVRYRSVPGTAWGMVVACCMARRRVACRMARRRIVCRMARRPIACRMARRRIACRMARRPIASRCIPARVGDLDVPAVFPVGRAEGPSSAKPRPNSAWSRRRHRRFTNMYSFTCLWRSIKSPSAARLRRTVGPLASRHAVAGQSQQRDIIGHIRAYPGIVRTSSEHRPGISGHFREYSDTRGRRMPYCPSPDRVP